MADKIQIRRDTTANWTSVNPVLAQGELGYNITLNQWKVGDAVTAWNSLAYVNVQGETGIVGAAGATGLQGIQGATGLAGANGAQGQTGIQGTTGLQGLNGSQGATGVSGVGTTGLQGETGLQGTTGLQGSTGLQGTTGAGIQGNTGLQGPQGVTGVGSGSEGSTGPQGVTGIQGATGLAGTNGTQGNTGISGATGLNGIQGLTGLQGTTGAAGTNGSNGATGLQGQTGVAGATGDQGVTGLQGATGAGVTGIQGLTGLQGIQGETGIGISNPMTVEIDLGENAGFSLDAALSADGKYSGIVESGTAGATLVFGDLVYFQTADSRWELASADNAAAGHNLKLAICVLAAAGDGSATKVLLWGKVRADAVFPTFTIGAPVYMSTTAGDVQVAAPSGTTDVVRKVGFGNTGDELYFIPSNDFIELV